MHLRFELQLGEGVKLPSELLTSIQSVLNATSHHFPKDQAGVSRLTVELVSAARIIELHGHYFDDPSVTDVITFPAEEGSVELVDGHALWMTLPADDHVERYLGDVAICVVVADEQATLAGNSLARELAFLSLHGALHLLGLDDHSDEERAEMLALQETILVAAEADVGPL